MIIAIFNLMATVAALGTIRVTDYLSDKKILLFPSGLNKEQGIEKLVELLDLPDRKLALRAILDRESKMSTNIGPGIMLPHGRIAGLEAIQPVIGLSASGIQYNGSGSDLIKLMLLFVGPDKNMKQHLEFLSCVSSLLLTEGLLDSLIQLNTPESILSKLKESEK